MYTYEERIRAVRLYIKLGKRVAATIRQLGYPTKNALKGWCREFESRLDLPVSYKRTKPKYSLEQKALAVEHYLEHGRCISATIKALGYPGRASLHAWIQELRPEGHTRVVGRSAGVSPALKRAAVIALCTREESAQAIAHRLGICRPTLYNWKNELLGPEVSASMKRHRELPTDPEREALERQLETLRYEVRRLQLEQDLLKTANELLKKDVGIIQRSLTNREKTLLVDALRPAYSLPELLDEVGLARSSYFYHRTRLDAADKYVEVRRTIADIFERNHRCYGYRRMRASLTKQHVRISEKVVQRLMKQERLVVATPKRRRYGSYMGEIGPAPENIVNRDFGAATPNEKWLTDITEFQIR